MSVEFTPSFLFDYFIIRFIDLNCAYLIWLKVVHIHFESSWSLISCLHYVHCVSLDNLSILITLHIRFTILRYKYIDTDRSLHLKPHKVNPPPPLCSQLWVINLCGGRVFSLSILWGVWWRAQLGTSLSRYPTSTLPSLQGLKWYYSNGVWTAASHTKHPSLQTHCNQDT